ncbi:MAG: C_GCAxxG_C_C family protein [Desulfobacteraceae bacterium]|nr:C_GCAxxG_C_C family protein [Desulfobacteraceae bacterium]
MSKCKQKNFMNELYSKKVKYAVDLMMKGYMCSESIVMAFANEFGLEPEIAARISGGFAGGMAQGKTCGAVTGAIMVIGLKYGAGLIRDQYSKDMCFQITQEFSYRFVARRKSIECGEILLMNNINPNDPEEIENLRERRLCDKIVMDSAEILEDLFREEEPQ